MVVILVVECDRFLTELEELRELWGGDRLIFWDGRRGSEYFLIG